jgi:hypothetical protein
VLLLYPIFYHQLFECLNCYWLRTNFIHASLETFFLVLFMDMACYSYYWKLSIFLVVNMVASRVNLLENILWVQKLTYLFCSLDSVKSRHFEISQDNLVSNALIEWLDKCVDSVLAIGTEINVVVNIDTDYIHQSFYSSQAKFFVVYYHDSAKFESLSLGILKILLLKVLLKWHFGSRQRHQSFWFKTWRSWILRGALSLHSPIELGQFLVFDTF